VAPGTSGTRATPEALLLDLDGVLRVFGGGVAKSVEREFGLPAGALSRSALSWARLRPVILGDETHEAWLDSIVLDLADAAGGVERARAAVRRWHDYRGDVMPEVLEFVRQLRADGVPVGLATNATSRLDADLTKLGLAGEFDAVINSSVIRAHKPTGEFFTAACAAVGKAPSRCLFVDDEDRNVRGARAAGLSAYRWTGPADLPYLRAALTT
jgi:putative hydrolase of the HAD superfamily